MRKFPLLLAVVAAKARPASWKDFFVPALHERPGS
jgi:hypothetical protein